jgi:FlaA1/EpsC-like NDP-sugar epimerase
LIEIKNDLLNSTIVVICAAGSIGAEFTKNLRLFNFKKIFVIDKDENQLTELNRELIIIFRDKIKKFVFICNDINLLNLENFIVENKISHYFNFAAVKHVRSEENLESIKYMIKTNCQNFLPANLKKINKLKRIFSISSDKAVKPSSILGLSKKIMELRLGNFKNKYKHVAISSARFANVSFSNGSILKLILDKIILRQNFGIPLNINRFFITHSEAVSLCFKSLLKECDNCIIIPNIKILIRPYSILSLCIKIIKILNLKYKLINKNKIKISNSSLIYLIKDKLVGQKSYEEFHVKKENVFALHNDGSVFKLQLHKEINVETKLNIEKIDNIKKLKIYFKRRFKDYFPIKSKFKISQSI